MRTRPCTDSIGGLVVRHVECDERALTAPEDPPRVVRTRIGAVVTAREVGDRVAQRHEVASKREHRGGVVPLAGDVARGDVAEREPGLDARLRETGTRLTRPRHRSAFGVTPDPPAVDHPDRIEHPLLGHVGVGHADLVAVVEERGPPQREQHEQRGPGASRVAARPAGREAVGVVVRPGPDRASSRVAASAPTPRPRGATGPRRARSAGA